MSVEGQQGWALLSKALTHLTWAISAYIVYELYAVERVDNGCVLMAWK
jgi:hypothetical protein